MKKEQKNDNRARVWSFVFYPESMPENYLNIINNWHVSCALSPLHDKDLDGNQDEKKEHYHIILFFDGKKSYEQIKEYSGELNSNVAPIKVESPRAMVRYLIHLDDPWKAQYDKSEIITFGGCNIDDYFETVDYDIRLCNKIESYIQDLNIDNFYKLYLTLKDYDEQECLCYLRFKNSIWFRSLLNGRWQLNHITKVNDDEN